MISDAEALDIIKFKLSKNRFNHSVQVAEMARQMAETCGVDVDKAYLTGLLHDYAKGISSQELINIAGENNLIENEVDALIPDLLHAPVGALLLQQELGVADTEILQAVKYHTTGSTFMTTLDKIIYLADMIEPGRDFPGIERLRCLALRDFDTGMLFGLESTIRYCLDQARLLHPRTVAARNHFLQLLKV
ncbi:MAG: bis(5'-nucleosyl)-tetraphosphatase (symmetrical) YqeK [Syntrophomonadaceae bacterium]|nr:bis(5'-nucleosyl)-tetraphosphatase (symmetrical) YqeK [Syntrophomonadaceae bacterium]MDD3889758.1 bis(5'-nucleosyl)-tetraphosphatase (symmetrical) YqeK [Syntrophomonadaceae bacterium]MDD4550154.1 bis(5'-nucleosyl)-tetraphosphatase (symmetrical) YqeK [Syntrophomonadaceae bacterium]